MVIGILSYPTSILNPFLKLIVLVLFVASFGIFLLCRQQYGGILRRVSTLLCAGSLAGILASAFRLEGDFYVQYKWGESILDLVVVVLMLVIALLIRTRMKEAVRLFGLDEEERGP
jgi:lysylphosphatidylglycerol synthetase-like protein (DUF2156 family)